MKGVLPHRWQQTWGNSFRFRLLLLALACLVAGCSTANVHVTETVFIVVRHAEKSDDGSRDPPLSETGRVHALALADSLQNAQLAAAYATPYRRTRDTALPAATAHGLQVTTYDAAQPADVLARHLRRAHPNGSVLVVGHSNTVPDIVAALCGCKVDPMAEDAFGDLYRIKLRGDLPPTLLQDHY